MLIVLSNFLVSYAQDVDVVPLQIGNSWYYEGMNRSFVDTTYYFSEQQCVIDTVNFSNQLVYVVENTSIPSSLVDTTFFYADTHKFYQSEYLSTIFNEVYYDELKSDTSWGGEFSSHWIRNTEDSIFGAMTKVQSRGSSFSTTMSSSWSQTRVAKNVGLIDDFSQDSQPWGAASRSYSLKNARLGMQTYGSPCRPVGVSIENNISSVNIDWLKNLESNITHYNIYMGTHPDSINHLIMTVPSTESSAEINSLQNQYHYYFIVKAVNSIFNESSASRVPYKPFSSPAVFSLIEPQHYSWIESETRDISILFSWGQAIDRDGDSIRYRFHLEGLKMDTVISNIASTHFQYTGTLNYFERYKWFVYASDGTSSIRCDEYFHFYIKPPAVKILKSYPNPFSEDIAFEFNLPGGTDFYISILNIQGRLIKTISVETVNVGGLFERRWDGTDDSNRQVVSGIYFCKLTTRDTSVAKKIILLK